ncbi:MAG TPA: hypothetical protein VFU94_14125, partial [Conexibacter sp.]|nr:hypothetical protein [Conexibacter sp.]
MFQRIARRHADRPDDPVAPETDEPVASAPAPGAGSASDAPTERIETVQAPAAADPSSVEQPTVLQRPLAPADDAAAPRASVPPPQIDL